MPKTQKPRRLLPEPRWWATVEPRPSTRKTHARNEAKAKLASLTPAQQERLLHALGINVLKRKKISYSTGAKIGPHSRAEVELAVGAQRIQNAGRGKLRNIMLKRQHTPKKRKK